MYLKPIFLSLILLGTARGGQRPNILFLFADHWHAIQALMAMKKGLHVCCEKPLTRYFEEGRALVDMARKSGVVFRVDTECRSNSYMTKTADLAMNGYLGTIRRMEIGVPKEENEGFGNPAPMPVPEHLDYDMWQGPAPDRPYTIDRVHQTDLKTGGHVGRPGWMRVSDYAIGMISSTQLRDSDKRVPTRTDKQDFIEAILNGSPVMIDAEAGHRVNTQCLLGLAAIKSGKALEWDPVAEKITNNPEAAVHITGTYRDPWDLKKFI